MLAALVAAMTIPACTPIELLPVGGTLQGATGSMLGTFEVKSLTKRRCIIGGRPKAALIGTDAKPLKTKARTLPRGVGLHVITVLDPGRTAVVRVQWSNWCGGWPKRKAVAMLALRLTLDTGITLSGPLRTGRPRCESKSLPSLLAVSAFGRKS
jgi:hypothetical protein